MKKKEESNAIKNDNNGLYFYITSELSCSPLLPWFTVIKVAISLLFPSLFLKFKILIHAKLCKM